MLTIGSFSPTTNLLLCPIAGYCDLAFRLTIRALGGVGLASTELVNPKGLLRQTARSMQLVETDPADRPLCIQLYGCEADEMAAAAQWAEANGASVVDINMGCPVDKVCKKNGGSALLRDLDAAVALAAGVVRAVRVPVTAKMRLGWDDGAIVAPHLAPRLENVGIAAITVHGRTAQQKFAGDVRIDGIARVVEAVRRIPVIGNGDIRTPQDAAAMIARTGCRGLMIGRAALGDPFIFRNTHAYLTTGELMAAPTIAERLAVMETHFGHLLRLRGERVACSIFRQRVSWYARHLGPCGPFRERMRLLSSAAECCDLLAGFRAGIDPAAETIEAIEEADLQLSPA